MTCAAARWLSVAVSIATLLVSDVSSAIDHGRSPAPAGPRVASFGEGATSVSSFEALADRVADPFGPSEIALAPGVYRGNLVIKRPVALRGIARGPLGRDGRPAEEVVLDGGGVGTVVTVDANDVTLDNLVVRGSGRRHTAEDSGIKATGERITVSNVRVEETLFGVSLQACRSCVVDGAHVLGYGDDTELRGDGIKLWEAHDSIVRRTTIERSRDLVVWYTRRALLEDDVVRAGRYGAHFMYAHDATVRRSRFEGNIVGVFVMYSLRLEIERSVLAGARGAAGVGLGFKDSDAVVVRGSWLVANTAGIYFDNTPRTPNDPVVVEGNLLALNEVGMRFHALSGGQSLRRNEFRNNAVLVEVDGGGDALSADARGNCFSDYEGYDLDGDGVGDVPHEVRALSSQLTESRPSLKLLDGTAAMALLDAVARAVPVFTSKKLFVDPAPLSRCPPMSEP